jgi:hypothetical protein
MAKRGYYGHSGMGHGRRGGSRKSTFSPVSTAQPGDAVAFKPYYFCTECGETARVEGYSRPYDAMISLGMHHEKSTGHGVAFITQPYHLEEMRNNTIKPDSDVQDYSDELLYGRLRDDRLDND